MSVEIERLRDEAKLLRDNSYLAAERHYAAETPWYYATNWVGGTTSVLSAIAGVAAFKNIYGKGGLVAGSISIFVAILTGLSTFLKPGSRAELHHKNAKAYETLYHQAGYFYRVESLSRTITLAALEKRLAALSSRFNELNTHAPALSGMAYKVSARKVASRHGEVLKFEESNIDLEQEN